MRAMAAALAVPLACIMDEGSMDAVVSEACRRARLPTTGCGLGLLYGSRSGRDANMRLLCKKPWNASELDMMGVLLPCVYSWGMQPAFCLDMAECYTPISPSGWCCALADFMRHITFHHCAAD